MRNHLLYDDYMVERLRDPSRAQQYLDVALEEYEADGDFAAFLLAIRRVAEARGGVEKLAEEAKLDVETVAAILAMDQRPSFEMLHAVLRALGFGLALRVRAAAG